MKFTYTLFLGILNNTVSVDIMANENYLDSQIRHLFMKLQRNGRVNCNLICSEFPLNDAFAVNMQLSIPRQIFKIDIYYTCCKSLNWTEENLNLTSQIFVFTNSNKFLKLKNVIIQFFINYPFF